MNETKKIDLLSLYKHELSELIASINEPSYRAKQIFTMIHRGVAPENITTISKATKQKLSEIAFFHLPKIRLKLTSKLDGTVKYLFELSDTHTVECVVMKYKHGNTVCVSSQVGCRMGCAFCASTIGGKARDLTASEILGQIIVAQNDTGERISNVVMMGIGEPLDNYDNVIRFLRLVGDEDGMNIGYRHISLSTCGLVDRIDALSKEDLPITLSISLHASNDETRSSIMPINKKWNISSLLNACSRYYNSTKRRISFEYTLISGKNDSESSALELAELLNTSLRPNRKSDVFPIHVNLIPVNPVTESGFSSSDKQAVKRFAAVLEQKGIRATVRRRLGSDINASCGQLRREKQAELNE